MLGSSPGYFGGFGGRYVPEVLIPALEDLDQAYLEAKADPEFAAEFAHLLATFAGRPIQVGWGIWGCSAVKRLGLTLGYV